MDPFLGEIRIVGFNFAPVDWALCDGSTVPISQNPTLYSLLGTAFGGDGVNTFKLPDFQGRIPVHSGTGAGLTPRAIGAAYGTEQVTLTPAQVPSHTHALQASTAVPSSVSPGNAVLAARPGNNLAMYTADTATPSAQLASGAIAPSGGSAAHDNVMPSLGLVYIINVANGYFPSRG